MNLLNVVPTEARAVLQEWLEQRGAPPFRLRQIVPRLWQRPAATWRDATDLPAPLRAALEDAWPLPRLTLGVRQESRDGTVKHLWRLADGGHPTRLLTDAAERPRVSSAQVVPAESTYATTTCSGRYHPTSIRGANARGRAYRPSQMQANPRRTR